MPPVGRTACTEPQCLYKGALYSFSMIKIWLSKNDVTNTGFFAFLRMKRRANVLIMCLLVSLYLWWATFIACGTSFLRCLTLILRRSRTGTVWFYTSTRNERAARPKLYTKSLTRDLKLMYSRFTLVRISITFRHRASCI